MIIIASFKTHTMGLRPFESVVRDTIHNRIKSIVQIIWWEDLKKLTEREIDIVRLITEGKKDKEISGNCLSARGIYETKLVVIRKNWG
jgi:DNA-binding NarL/FixJ family response regulator